jgi:hypothetical protein
MASGDRMSLARRQQGQSLVLASTALMLAALVLLLMFNTAQLTRSKMELQNTADATAYSVATIAARDYNFTAYMNRAMVANQVAVAQMVGLASWFHFTGQTLQNVTALCAPIPGLDAICASMLAAYKGFDATFDKAVFPFAVKALNGWMTALSDLEVGFHYGNAEALLQNLVHVPGTELGVLARNDPEASLVPWPDPHWPPGNITDIPDEIRKELYRLGILIKDASDWWKFTTRYKDSDPGMSRFAEVTRESLDHFSNSRSWDLHGEVYNTDWIMDHLPSWLKDLIENLLPVHISASIDLGLVRRGGTELKQVNDKYSWSAADTLMGEGEAKIKVEVICGFKPCKHFICPVYCGKEFDEKIDIPLGWGAGYSLSSGDDTPGEDIFNSGLDDSQYDGAAAGMAKATFELAVGEYGEVPLASFGGLSPYYDISKPAPSNDGPQFTILLSKRSDTVRTASRAGFGAPADGAGPFGLSNLRLDEPPSGADTFYAVSKGRLHFSQDGQYSNLFSPYWEAKLADTTDDERKEAFENLHKPLPATPVRPPIDLSGLSPYAH